MKNVHSYSPHKVSLIKIAVLGVVGLVLLVALQLLEMAVRATLTHAVQMDRGSQLIVAMLLVAVVILFGWFSLNAVIGIGLAMILGTETLARTLTFIKRLPLKIGRWLLRPYVAIIQWAIDLRQTPTVN